MKTSLYRLMVETAAEGLTLQREDGSLPPGHNGPHGDPERPSRNTGHWAMNWCFAHRETGETRFRDAAARAADYLMLPEHRPGGYTVHHRDSAGKDRCNGLMGPAFTLESLAAVGSHLGRQDLLSLAAEIVRMHPFDARRGLWQVREIDGSLPGIDWTLNHQIWFAACVGLVSASTGGDAAAHVISFLDSLKHTMVLRPNGRIRHLAQDIAPAARAKSALGGLFGRGKDAALPAKEHKREVAYHFFSIYPLTMLKQQFPEHAFWSTEIFSRAYRYPFEEEYSRASDDPAFVQPHIPAGFPLGFAERAFANQVFGPEDLAFQRRMLAKQFQRTYAFDERLLSKGSADPITQAARSYEMTRLADVAFEIDCAETQEFSAR
ncbi:MAG TPA: hypothetical protein VNX29_02140 [Kaistia sp.]|nr:hypothetical protein [Kaistia sp.]